MSLIQDALKRKSEESGPEPGPLPPQPVQPPEPSPAKRPHALMISMILLLIALLLLLLTGLAFYLIRTGRIPDLLPKMSIAPLKESSVTTPEAPAPAAARKTLDEPSPEAAPAPEPAVPKPLPGIPAEWPDVKLTGVAISDNQSIAILNGRMLSAGRMLGDVRVSEVREASVVLEYKGERRILYIDD
jgi:hypothetical protein